MNPEDLRVLPVCVGSCCCFWLVFTAVALPLSFKTLDQGFYALELNWHSQKIGEEVATEPGLRMIGLGNMLVTFPSTYQTMYFVNEQAATCEHSEEEATCFEVVRSPIFARSADGLEMSVSVSFQWRLQPQALHPLYIILGQDLFLDEFVRFARASLIESCSHYSAHAYFTNRTAITSMMLDTLSHSFTQAESGLQVSITALQLREVDLPDQFDAEIASTQEQMQEVEIATAERGEQTIQMERQVLVATEAVQQRLQAAYGESSRILLENQAYVDQLVNMGRKRARANSQILQTFTNDKDPYGALLSLMKVRALEEHTNSKLLVNLNNWEGAS